MNSLNWPRIVLCGLVAGATFALLTMVLVGASGGDFLAAAGAHAAAGDGATRTGPGLHVATIAAGPWAMWLYAVVRPRFASNLGAVMAVGLAWWLIAGLQSLKWILLLGISFSACLPLAWNLVPTVFAVLVGATLFSSGQPDQPAYLQ
ncbi:MAG TPA: hypothetical protein VFY20_06175 [Gemmatimonadales bacterium]|nr:hypothetical protein [Gemmatimonadales bacterium]